MLVAVHPVVSPWSTTTAPIGLIPPPPSTMNGEHYWSTLLVHYWTDPTASWYHGDGDYFECL